MNKKLVVLTLLAIVAPILFFGLVSCMKKPNHQADYGSEVPLSEVQKALNELGRPDVATIHPGEFAYHETTQTLDIQSPLVVLQKGQTITAKSETATEYIFTIVTQLNEYINGSMQSSTDTGNVSACKIEGGCQTPLTIASEDAPIVIKQGPVSFKSMAAKAEETRKKVTYHKLEKTIGFYPIPDAVRARADCGGLADCSRSLRVMQINVNQVVWDTPDRGTLTAYEFVTSPDVPFFSFDLVTCAQSWIDYENRTISIRQCDTVKDFRKGTPAP